ncbi:TrmB family transcriptional regulator [bacterium]|nr:TrmB family transcriptional regulator [bacterium]
MENVVEKLKSLGFNSYEAKTYIALLKKYPATGYEVSQLADIPQSRAYDALKSLANEKIVIASDDKPQKYSPIAPKELTQRFKRKINSTIEYLEKKLPDVKEDYNEPLHNISGYENILVKLKEIIKNAKKSIYIEIWKEDFKHVEKELRAAYDRDVDVKIVALGEFTTNFGLVYQHAGAKEIVHNSGSRLIYILSDIQECLFGKIECSATWTKNIDVVYLLLNFIVHDMYLLDVGQNFPEQLKYFYGAGMKNLKNKILSKDGVNIH